MEKRVEASVGERVELVYTPTRDELTQAFKERAKITAERWMRKLAPFMVVGCAAVVVIDLVLGDGLNTNMLIGAALFGGAAYGLPVLVGHQAHKMTARTGEHRVVVDPDGWTLTHGTASGHNTWLATPRYAETDDVFVLLSGDKYAACVYALPKRGIQSPADPDTLRALLDRHITRV